MPNTDMVQCMNHVKASSETACESINVRKDNRFYVVGKYGYLSGSCIRLDSFNSLTPGYIHTVP